MANNPAFNRIEKDAQNGYAGFRTDGATTPQAATGSMTAQQLQELYNQPSATPVRTDRVTMDDVIMKTLGLFAIVVVTGGIGWVTAAANPGIGFALWMGGAIGILVLGMVIAFRKTLSVPLILLYAVVEGVFVGAVSQYYSLAFDEPGTPAFEGIVAQAVMATLATFGGMFLAYRFGLIKVTERFRKVVTMMIFGYAIFAVVNFVYAVFFSGSPFGFGGSGWLGIGISLFAVGLASFTLALDFDAIDRAIATGAPRPYAWLLAHGLIVTLVWLYLEFLRLLGRMRS